MNYAPPLPMQPDNAPLDVRAMHTLANVMLLLVALAVLLLAVQWAANRGVFTIARLRITGDLEHSNPISVRAHALGRLQGTFFTLDLARAKGVFEEVPWVRSAVVRRIWPNGLLIEISEHKAAALWGVEGQEKLLNIQGEVFTANPDEVEVDLPRLIGPAGSSSKVLNFYRSLSQRIEARSLRIVTLSLSVRQEWSAELDDGMLLILGRDDGELWARLDRYLRTQEQTRLRLGQISSALGQAWVRVDLRHNLGYAVAIGSEGRESRQEQSSRDGQDSEAAPSASGALAASGTKNAINSSVKNEPSRSQGR